MKRIIALLLTALFVVASFGVCASADDMIVTVFVDGKQVEFDVYPMLNNGRTLVPMRAVFEALGAEVSWDNDTNTATAVKDDITLKITVGTDYMYKNDELITLDVGSILLNDRTLVPVRAISESFGCKVEWEEATYTVNVYSAAVREVVEASTADELLNAIGSNKEIVLTSEYYNLSDATAVENEFVNKEKYYDCQWIIGNVNNIKITGNAKIVVDDIMADVLYFVNCSDITLDGLTVGHTQPEEGYKCEGAVVEFNNCKDVSVENCNLFGCGAVGVMTYESDGVYVKDSKIYDCTYTGTWLTDTKNAVFTNCEIFDFETDYSGFCRLDNSDAEFVGCNIHDIVCDEYLIDSFDFEGEPSYIALRNCTFEKNTYTDVIGIRGMFIDCKSINNDGPEIPANSIID